MLVPAVVVVVVVAAVVVLVRGGCEGPYLAEQQHQQRRCLRP